MLAVERAVELVAVVQPDEHERQEDCVSRTEQFDCTETARCDQFALARSTHRYVDHVVSVDNGTGIRSAPEVTGQWRPPLLNVAQVAGSVTRLKIFKQLQLNVAKLREVGTDPIVMHCLGTQSTFTKISLNAPAHTRSMHHKSRWPVQCGHTEKN